MIWNPIEIIQKKSLGIDIGTSSIKIVEMSWFGEKRELKNFGELSISILQGKSFKISQKNSFLLSSMDIAEIIQAILQEAEIQAKLVNFSIPDFATFFTSFELPPMTEEELSQAIKYTARQHIPLPLSEVTLDWQIIEGEFSKIKPTKLKVLLVSVPNQIIGQCQEIAHRANLKLSSVEAEAFALNRSLIKKEDKEKVVILVDIGTKSTTMSIIDKNVLKSSYSIDIAGNKFTSIIANFLNIDYNKAEKIKKKYGIMFVDGYKEDVIKAVGKHLIPLIDLILTEIKKISRVFEQAEGKKVDKCILAGGSALLPGLENYCVQKLGKEIIIAEPFSDISYSSILDKTMKEIGPSFATATGLALRGVK